MAFVHFSTEFSVSSIYSNCGRTIISSLRNSLISFEENNASSSVLHILSICFLFSTSPFSRDFCATWFKWKIFFKTFCSSTVGLSWKIKCPFSASSTTPFGTAFLTSLIYCNAILGILYIHACFSTKAILISTLP